MKCTHFKYHWKYSGSSCLTAIQSNWMCGNQWQPGRKIKPTETSVKKQVVCYVFIMWLSWQTLWTAAFGLCPSDRRLSAIRPYRDLLFVLVFLQLSEFRTHWVKWRCWCRVRPPTVSLLLPLLYYGSSEYAGAVKQTCTSCNHTAQKAAQGVIKDQAGGDAE